MEHFTACSPVHAARTLDAQATPHLAANPATRRVRFRVAQADTEDHRVDSTRSNPRPELSEGVDGYDRGAAATRRRDGRRTPLRGLDCARAPVRGVLLVVTDAVGTSGTAITQRVHSLNRPNMVSVGTVVWLSSELMFFAGLFAMYFTARAQADPALGWPPPPTHLAFVYTLIFTIILVASSFTCQMGVFSAERGDVFGLRRWYALTMVMGLTFVIGEANDYHTSVSEGTTVSSDAYGSVYYITTGFHMLHVIGGLTAFAFLIARTKLSKFTPAQATAAIVVSYYWHFVDIVWIGLFATIFIVR